METETVNGTQGAEMKKEVTPIRFVPQNKLADMVPKSIPELETLSKVLVRAADMVPKEYKGKPWEVLFTGMLHGLELGLYPLQALQCVMVVNGKPSIYGDAALALVLGSGKMTDWDETFVANYVNPETKQAEGNAYVVSYQRVGKKSPIVQKFSVLDATVAKLWKKEGPWTNYPHRMLQMRSRGFGLRDGFADVLKGLILVEEARDFIDTTVVGAPLIHPKVDEINLKTEPTPEQPVVDAAPKKPVIGRDERLRIFELIKTNKIPQDTFKTYLKETYGVEGTDKLPSSKYGEVCRWIAGEQEEIPFGE